jgi:hypothetical protein
LPGGRLRFVVGYQQFFRAHRYQFQGS